MAKRTRLTLLFLLTVVILMTGWLMAYGGSCGTDVTPPTSSHTLAPKPNSVGWNNSSPVVVTITAIDNCGMHAVHYVIDTGAEITVPGATAAVTVSGEGTHIVEYWAVDNAGNIETPHNTATIRIDKSPPGVPAGLTPAAGTITNDTSPTLSWSAPSDSGGSGLKNYRYQVDNDSDFSSPLKNGYTTNTHYTPTLVDGTYYWRVRARDNAGNNGDWTAGRRIIIDTKLPQISCTSNITQSNDPGSCGAVVSWNTPLATDNIGIAYVTCAPPSGSVFSGGTTVVTCTATDVAGNSATCTFAVTVNDTEPPTDPIVSSSNHTVGKWSSNPDVRIQASGASDNCGVGGFEYAWGQNPGWAPTHNKMAAGTWTGGTFTATSSGDWYFHLATVDNAGNWTGTVHLGPFKIDIDPPGVPSNLSPSDGTIITDNTPTLSWNASVDTGGSGLKNYRYQVDNDSDFSSPFKNGYTTNTHYTPTLVDGTYYWRVRARDNAGNNGDWTASRKIIIDTEPPQITCPDDIAVDNDPGECGAVVTYTVDYSDNCSGATIEQIAGLVSGSQFPVGTTTHTFRVTDAAGNTAQCAFTVTVNDTEKPVVSGCPSDITVGNDPGSCGAVVSWTELTASDNCAIATFSSDHHPGDYFPVGTTTVSYTATDIYGNSSTGSFDVTVNDVEAPTTVFVSTPPDPDNNAAPNFGWIGTDNNNCTSSSSLLYSTKLDGGNWSGWSSDTSITLSALAEGPHTFQVRVKDEAGNVGTAASYTWFLDLTPPTVTIITPENKAEYVLNDHMLADWAATDGSSGLKSAVGTVAFGNPIDTLTPGAHNFTVTATDRAGNVTTVTVVYRVVYNVTPGGAAGAGGGGAAGEQQLGFLDKTISGQGGAVGIASLDAIYTVGDIIHAGFSLADAAGNAVTDALVTGTLIRVTINEEEKESYEILGLFTFLYDEETGRYQLDIKTTNLQPGIYDLWLGFDDGTTMRSRMQLNSIK